MTRLLAFVAGLALGWYARRPKPEPEDWPDGMCPNCVTPWKCNGPHIDFGHAPSDEHPHETCGDDWATCTCPNGGAWGHVSPCRLYRGGTA